MGTAMTEYTLETAWAELDETTKAILEEDYQRRKARHEAQVARFMELEAERARLDAETFKLMEEMGW